EGSKRDKEQGWNSQGRTDYRRDQQSGRTIINCTSMVIIVICNQETILQNSIEVIAFKKRYCLRVTNCSCATLLPLNLNSTGNFGLSLDLTITSGSSLDFFETYT